MKRVTTATGLLSLVAMIVLGAFSAGSASANSFLWSGPLPGLVLALSDGPQVFEAVAGFAVSCKHFKGDGRISNGTGMSAKSVTVGGEYSGCTVPSLSIGATVTAAAFEVSATESVAVTSKPITITIPELNCSLKIASGSPNNNLNTIKFLNKPSDILADVNVTQITSVASGEPCGKIAGEVLPGGTYTGVLLLSVDGGSLKWDTKP